MKICCWTKFFYRSLLIIGKTIIPRISILQDKKGSVTNLTIYERMPLTTCIRDNWYYYFQMSGTNKIKLCPICGCSEHRLIGCFSHWRKHTRNGGERCEAIK